MPLAPSVLPEMPPMPAMPFEPQDVEVPDEENSTQDGDATITVNEDGSVIVDFSNGQEKKESKFDENLANKISEFELDAIASDLLLGIEDDIESRREWETSINRGVDLLGLKMEEAGSDVSAQGSISKVFHPLLLEAVVRYQSNACAEMLPAIGPVKVREADPKTTQQSNELADALEKDMNTYLTVVAKEYYPDYERMLFSQGFCGIAFRKLYHCPLRGRPADDFVPATDLIVSNDAVSLNNVQRITHRTLMRQSVMKRMQKAGYYRDTELVQPNTQPTPTETKIKQNEGINPQPQLPADHQHTIYECYTELNIAGFEENDGIPVPYCITMDKDSRKVLAVYRNWEKGDENYKMRRRFVKYGLIPGLGFYDYGYIHLLGNTTRALTAIERQLLDAGQFANFPGFLISKQGQRQETTQIRVPPGGGFEINTNGQPINQAIMPLPYKEPSSVLAALAEKIAEDGRRLAQTLDINVGEGRADVPVGTVVAMIEQSTKIMAAIHKRNHAAQQEEFEILKDLFKEDPEALWKFAKSPARKWQMAEEFDSVQLIPASDPNVPSHIHRIMQAVAIGQLAAQSPQIYNLKAIHERILGVIGVQDVDSLFAPPPQGAPPPSPQEMLAKMQIDLKQMELQLQTKREEREANESVLEAKRRIQEQSMEDAQRTADRISRENIAQTKVEIEKMKLMEKNIDAKDARLHDTIENHLSRINAGVNPGIE